MLYDPNQSQAETPPKIDKKSFERLKNIRQTLLLKKKKP
jgi:hypothetical protein